MLAVVIAAALAVAPLQEPPPPPGGPPPTDSLLRVFVDCPNYVPGCDLNFFRTEVTWIDYVRDRESADIHALATALQTGGGGWEYTIALIGRGRWAGRVDTLRFTSPGTAVYDEQRRTFVQQISLGLARYAVATSAGRRLTLAYRAPGAAGQRAATAGRDPWNYWVFQIRLRGSWYGQKCCHDIYQSGSLSADRVTDHWKFRASARYGENISRFTYPVEFDTAGTPVRDTTESVFNKDYGGVLSVVRSIGRHWSARAQGTLNRSTSDNIHRQLDVGPAIEYDVFPYSESTRRQLTAQLGIAVRRYEYDSITIYLKQQETRATGSFALNLSVTQPWGNGSIGAGHTVFLDNARQSNTYVSAFANVRVFRGFSLDIYAFRAQVRDQVYLPARGASSHDVLLRRRAVETNYRYSLSFGVSYRFGSTNNNIVNPRFGGGGGVFFFN